MPMKTLTPNELFDQIGAPDAPFIVDVCLDEDFAENPRLIPTARRCAFDKILSHASLLADRETVIICQKGLKLSQGCAALLRSEGRAARHLDGGMIAWTNANLPTVAAKALPPQTRGDCPIWVTGPSAPETHLASWHLRRFIAPTARILNVEADQITNVAERFNAQILADATLPVGLNIPALEETLTRAPTLLLELWPGLTEAAADTLLDALYASRKSAQ